MRTARTTTSETVRLLEVDPDLGALLSEPRRAEAERDLVARMSGTSADHIGLLVLDGILSRELIVADHVSAELLGPGDVLRPWQTGNRASLLPVDAVWSAMSR